ncbi:MAG: Npun_F0494 family protein, partial [Microcoleus sp.]
VESGYTRSPVSELVAENSLLWLIQVGVLRREVDGQGITDSFRLTPLGRQLVEKWEQEKQGVPAASLCDRMGNAVSRGLGLFL